MRNRRRLVVLLALFGLALVALTPMGANAAVSVPSGFNASIYVSGFADRVTAMDWSPDGRLFVSEKTGNLRVVKGGKLLSQPFLHVAVNSDSERGLLGVTFDPNFSSNRFVYVFYTSTAAKNRVSRFTASSSNPDVVQSGSEKILLDNIPSDAGNHNGGAVHFGLDGKLYISVGDSSNGPNSQSLSSLSGKLLRINSDGSIPSDNPFVGQSGRRPEIWAYGLRNPYTFAFKPGTSTLFINDVGFNTWEEINRGVRGANYGWPICEGVCSTSGMTNPIYEYNHNDGPGKAITGGVFYNGGKFPSAYAGDYFFADYVGGYIKSFDATTGAASGFATGVNSPVDLRVGPDGALYYLSVNGMLVGRIMYGSAPPPTPTPTPTKPPVGNPPRPTITLPAAGSTYRAGDVISYSGSATDPEDGTLGAARLTWEVVFHHDTHTHPYIEPFSGVTHGTFTIEDRGETSPNVWYRIHLRATDSDGNTAEVTRDIHPLTSTVTLATAPSGLQVSLDGTPVTTPYSFTGVQQLIRRVTAPQTQVMNGTTYEFVSWSDGGAIDHEIRTPNTATTFTATYRATGQTTTYAADAFARTVSSGWGRADTGGAWSTSGSHSQLSVSNGVGSCVLSGALASRAMLLPGVNVANVDVRVRVRTSATSAGGPAYVYILARSDGASEYRPKLLLQPNGTVAVQAGVAINGVETSLGSPVVVSGLRYTPGTFLSMRVQVTGANPTTIRVKVWASGAQEPSQWQFVATDRHAAVQDAGQLGLRAYLSSRSTNSSVTIGFDDYRVVPPG